MQVSLDIMAYILLSIAALHQIMASHFCAPLSTGNDFVVSKGNRLQWAKGHRSVTRHPNAKGS